MIEHVFGFISVGENIRVFWHGFLLAASWPILEDRSGVRIEV